MNAGKFIVRDVPSPTMLSIVIVPPLSSIKFFVIAKPNPIPLILVENKGSKIDFMFSSDMPHPVSVILIMTLSL